MLKQATNDDHEIAKELLKFLTSMIASSEKPMH